MNMNVKLIKVTRKNGNTTDDDSRVGKMYAVKLAAIGRSAILPLLDNYNQALYTSSIEEIEIFDRLLRISTRNTEYDFEII